MQSSPKVKLGKVIICSNLVSSTLFDSKISFLSIFYIALTTLIWAYLPWFYHIRSISKNWGIQKYHHECSLGVNLVIDNILYVASDTLHLKDLGDTKVSSTNAAWVLI